MINQNNGNFDRLPVCIQPWLYLILAWNELSVCCVGIENNFGSLNNEDGFQDFSNEIWNSKSYIKIRNELLQGELSDLCKACSIAAFSGRTIPHNKYGLDALFQISFKKA